MSRARRPAAGFTLLELLVASAILALLAVIGWRGLDSVLTSRDRIVRVSDDVSALTVAFSQMDEDLRRSWPVRLLSLGRPSILFASGGEGGPVMLQLLREGGAATDASRIERVAYRLVGGRFERGFGPLLEPGAPAEGGLPFSSAPLVWQPLLEGVASLQWRAWVPARGWIEGTALAADPSAGGVLALAGVSGVTGVSGAAGGLVAPPGGGVASAGGTAGVPPTAAAAPGLPVPAITGVEVLVIRADGQRFVRTFPVTD